MEQSKYTFNTIIRHDISAEKSATRIVLNKFLRFLFLNHIVNVPSWNLNFINLTNSIIQWTHNGNSINLKMVCWPSPETFRNPFILPWFSSSQFCSCRKCRQIQIVSVPIITFTFLVASSKFVNRNGGQKTKCWKKTTKLVSSWNRQPQPKVMRVR